MPDLPADFILKTELQIAKLQETLAAWKETGLPEKTILILLSHSVKLSQANIKKVLQGLDTLYEDYFKDKE